MQSDKAFQSLFEKGFSYFMSPLESFIRKQTTSGILLIFFSVVAFAISNSGWNDLLEQAGQAQLGLFFEKWNFSFSVKDWISQGLMTLFFFLTGLELKREILAGKLTDSKEIILVTVAASGGIAIPALIYYSINLGGFGQHGWAIPTATDTAFAIGILALFARRVSLGLTIFLMALAIFDDIGAIVIISLFYAHEINLEALVAAFSLFLSLLAVNKLGIRKGWIYSIIGILLWASVLQAGIHPTLSGLLLAIAIPARAAMSESNFIKNIAALLKRFEQKQDDDISMLGSAGKHSLVSDIGQNAQAASTPLQRWEMSMIIPISIIVLPLFALFNAGFPLTKELLTEGLSSPITWGIIFGLVGGKPAGILLFSYLILKSGLGRLPYGVSFKDIVGVSMLTGIGFTMSVFFTTLSFPGNTELIDLAKLGILIASITSAISGSVWIYFKFPRLV